MCSLRSLFLSFMLTVSICAAVVPGVAVGQATVVPVVNNLVGPYGVAVATNGDLYIADTFGSRIYRVPAGTPLPVASPAVFVEAGISLPYALSFAPNGDLYVADAGPDAILRIPAGTTARGNGGYRA